jgi:hypothetical protein
MKKRKMTKRSNRRRNARATTAKVTGWVKAKAVKIVRNKRGQATAVRIKT